MPGYIRSKRTSRQLIYVKKPAIRFEGWTEILKVEIDQYLSCIQLFCSDEGRAGSVAWQIRESMSEVLESMDTEFPEEVLKEAEWGPAERTARLSDLEGRWSARLPSLPLM